uniref:Uncharacterized protein n=1 Tax=Pithovirus LCDPAC02 TaxID=2506601 RepID=A0A481YNX4_9VIRU|nr:MAG: hypothetical protein LCDPAC02_01600 [Pithovirus LCDPAC02]
MLEFPIWYVTKDTQFKFFYLEYKTNKVQIEEDITVNILDIMWNDVNIILKKELEFQDKYFTSENFYNVENEKNQDGINIYLYPINEMTENELVEFPEDKKLLYKYVLESISIYDVVENTITIPSYSKKILPKINKLILEFKETKEYKIYIEEIKENLIIKIAKSIGRFPIYKDEKINRFHKIIQYSEIENDMKMKFLISIYKDATKKLNEGIIPLYSTYLHSELMLDEVYSKHIISRVNLPIKTNFNLDFEIESKPSFRDFVLYPRIML